MMQVDLAMKEEQTHRRGEQTPGCQRAGLGAGRTRSLGSAAANCSLKDGSTTRSYCLAQGTVCGTRDKA